MEQRKQAGFNVFSYADDIRVSRLGKNVSIVGRDNTSTSSDTVEANLLYEILKVLKKK